MTKGPQKIFGGPHFGHVCYIGSDEVQSNLVVTNSVITNSVITNLVIKTFGYHTHSVIRYTLGYNNQKNKLVGSGHFYAGFPWF